MSRRFKCFVTFVTIGAEIFFSKVFPRSLKAKILAQVAASSSEIFSAVTFSKKYNSKRLIRLAVYRRPIKFFISSGKVLAAAAFINANSNPSVIA